MLFLVASALFRLARHQYVEIRTMGLYWLAWEPVLVPRFVLIHISTWLEVGKSPACEDKRSSWKLNRGQRRFQKTPVQISILGDCES